MAAREVSGTNQPPPTDVRSGRVRENTKAQFISRPLGEDLVDPRRNNLSSCAVVTGQLPCALQGALFR